MKDVRTCRKRARRTSRRPNAPWISISIWEHLLYSPERTTINNMPAHMIHFFKLESNIPAVLGRRNEKENNLLPSSTYFIMSGARPCGPRKCSEVPSACPTYHDKLGIGSENRKTCRNALWKVKVDITLWAVFACFSSCNNYLIG